MPHPLLAALHQACAEGDVGTIELLAKRGASVTERDRLMGWSAIHHACNQPQSIRAVLALGADANAEDDYQMTALHLAAENGAYDAVRVLSKICRRRRGSIEYLASKQGHDDVCELLQRRWSGAPDSDDEPDPEKPDAETSDDDNDDDWSRRRPSYAKINCKSNNEN